MKKFFDADASEEQLNDRIRTGFMLKDESGSRQAEKLIATLSIRDTEGWTVQTLTFRSRVALPDHQHTWRFHSLSLVTVRPTGTDDGPGTYLLFDATLFMQVYGDRQHVVDSEVCVHAADPSPCLAACKRVPTATCDQVQIAAQSAVNRALRDTGLEPGKSSFMQVLAITRAPTVYADACFVTHKHNH